MIARHAPKLTAADRKASLMLALYRYQARMLDHVTVEELMSRTGCDRKTVEYELTIARQKRAGEAR